MGSNQSAQLMIRDRAAELKVDHRFLELQNRAHRLGHELDVRSDGRVTLDQIEIDSLMTGSTIEGVLADIAYELVKLRSEGYVQYQ